jgi:hypothetical protein
MFLNTASHARQSERHEIVLPIRARQTADTADRVRLVNARADDTPIEGDLIDLSRGGLGFMTTRFLPKGARLDARVCGLDADPSRPVLVARVRVQRVRMTDSRPAYLIGAAFIDSDAVFEHDLELLLQRLRASETDCQADASGEGA